MKKIKFEALKMGHIALLTKVKSPLVEGIDEQQEGQELEMLLDYVYVTNATKKASASAKKGTWYEDSIEFGNQFTQEQFDDFMKNHLAKELKAVNEARVEVIPDKDAPPKKKAQKSTT